MTFEDFRSDIENKLSALAPFELQEFHFQPYNFGSGILAYRVNGTIHKMEFDGRENQLRWFTSHSHEKYSKSTFKEVLSIQGLEISKGQLDLIINNGA